MKFRKYISLLFLILFSGALFAQKSNGDKHYDRLEYAEAIKHYKKDYEKNGDLESLSRLADCYYKTHQYSEALKYYQEKEKTGLNSTQLFALAQLYYENEQPEKGKEYLRKYAAAAGSQWWMDYVDGVKILNEEKNNYLISNVKHLNTEYSEFCPQFSEGELIFTSDRPASKISSQTYGGTGTPFLNIYVTDNFSLTDSNYISKSFYEKSDVSAHAGPSFWDVSGQTLYYTFVNDIEKGQVNRATIYKVKKEGKKWLKPEMFPFATSSSIGHPAVYNNEITILSSDLPSGKGGKDLYLFYQTSAGNRIVPIPGVNTPGDEVFPSLRKMNDGTYRLYFSSNGFPGKGGLDFFSVIFDEAKPDTTIIWHKELSSSHDDFGITFENDSRGFFSSDRNGGKGGDDIYFFIENPNAVQICLTCIKDGSSCSGKAVEVKKDNRTLETVYTDENGCIFLKKLPDGANALQLVDNSSDEIKVKSFVTGVNNNGKLVVLDKNGQTILEIINEDGKMITEAVRTVWLTDHVNGGPAKGIRIQVKSVNGEVVETIITDSEGKAVLRKIPPGDKFLLEIDADEVYLDPSFKKDTKFGIVLLDQFGKITDSLSSHHRDIRIAVLKIKTVDLCLYNQITGEPLAHYRVTLRAQDGTPIDTAITDAEGCYKFKKLPQGDMLLTIENFDGGAIKARVSGMEESGINNLIIQNSKGMVIESMSADGTKLAKTFCVFDKSTGKPVVNTLVHLANEQMVIMDSVFTGTDGCFTYKRLIDGGRNLNLLVAADEAEFFIKGKESDESNRMKYAVYSGSRLILDSLTSSSSDYSLGILQKLILSGCLTSKTDGKPLAFTKIYFRDEKGKKLDSTITDKNGCFEYKKLGDLPAQVQVMANDDKPFIFAMNSNTSIPNKLGLTDKNNNTLSSIDPTFKRNTIPVSQITFYDQNDNHPVSGMEVKIISDAKEDYLVTDLKGQVSYEFVSGKSYKVEIPAGKISVTNSVVNGGYTIAFKSEKNTVNGSFSPESEIILKVNQLNYITASFKTAKGNPVSDLPVEWYDERTGKWNMVLTEDNGESRHVYSSNPKEMKIRVIGKENEYDFTMETKTDPDVKLVDASGNVIGTATLNANKTFAVTVRPFGQEKGEMDITGIISTAGNPVNGATVYVRTPQGILIQKTATDKDGNYFFRKLPSSSMMLEVDTSDLRMKFKTTVEINGTMTATASGKKVVGAEVMVGDGTGLKLEIQNTDNEGKFDFNIDLEKVYAGIENSKNNPWDKLTSGVNQEIIINSIYFDYDKWNITFESERELDKATKFLKDNLSASLNIKAHTDSRGGDDYNLILSRKRAKSVMNYFRDHGVDTMRLMSFGLGETQLINKCDDHNTCSDAMHKKNRRIEFEISWNGTAHNTRAASPLITNNTTNTSNTTNTTNTTSTANTTNTSISNNTTTSAGTTESGRWYKVQITTSAKLIPLAKENFKGLENVEYYIDNGIYKYTVGKFATKDEAITYRKNVIDLFPQAFPVILENGVRVK